MITYKYLNIFYIIKLHEFLKNNDEKYFKPHKFNYLTLIKNVFNKDVFIIQLIENDIVGYGMLRGWEEGYNIPILGIMIDKEHRGMGLSKSLMDNLHWIAKLMGSKKVMLKVFKNNDIAVNLYKKCNYEFSEYDNKLLVGYKTI